MNNYRNNRSGGGRNRGYGGRDSGPRQMHKAVCDECGNNCEVPFRPTGDKPIYCSDCFSRKNGGDSRSGSGRPSRRGGFSRPDRGRRGDSNQQVIKGVNSLNEKLDRIIRLLESKTESESKPAPKATKIKKATKTKEVKEEVKPKAKKATKKKTAKTSKGA